MPLVLDISIVNADAMYHKLKKSNIVLNIGSGKCFSINYIVKLLSGDIIYIPKRPGEPEITWSNINKAKKLLCHDYIFSTETPSQLAGLYGYYPTLAHAELALSYPTLIQQYSVEKLQDLAYQYLSPQRYAITVMEPC